MNNKVAASITDLFLAVHIAEKIGVFRILERKLKTMLPEPIESDITKLFNWYNMQYELLERFI